MNRVQIEITLGLLFVLASSTILTIYATKEEQRMQEFAMSQEAQAIEVGAALFENNCSPCHGKQGEGTPGLAPALNDGFFFTDRLKEVGWSGSLEDYIVATASSGRLTSTRPEYVGGGKPAMPAWSERYGGPLREDQIRNLARFVLNWEASAMGSYVPVEVSLGAESEDPLVRGQAVYEANGCAGCHTLGSLSAGAVGPNLTAIGSVAATREAGVSAEEYLKQSILSPNAFIAPDCPTGPCPENVMPATIGAGLSEQQLNDLVAFLASLK
jgi:mono/diheme cytochrome c family protein